MYQKFGSITGEHILLFCRIGRVLTTLLKIVANVALLISASMAARITAGCLGSTIGIITFQTSQKSLKEAMQMRNVPACVQSHMLHYLENAYITYNRIAMSGAAALAMAIPKPLKSTKVCVCMFARARERVCVCVYACVYVYARTRLLCHGFLSCPFILAFVKFTHRCMRRGVMVKT